MRKANSTILKTLWFCAFCGMISAQSHPLSDAEFYIRQGNYQSAMSSLNEYIEENPSEAIAYIKRAHVHQLLGQMKEKEKDLSYANYLNPLAYMYVSKTSRSRLYDKKKYDYGDQSISFKKSPVINKYYQTYLKDTLDLHSQDSLLVNAIYYLSKNDLTNTELALSEIDETDNIKGILYDLYGLVNLKKDRLDEAIDYFSMCIEQMPKFPLAYHNRAIAYKLQGNYDKAKQDLDTALSLNEDISVFYFTLAKLSEKLKDPNQAINYYQEAIDKNPNYIEARTNYSVLQKTLGNYEEAFIDLENIANNTDNQAKSHFINGGLYLTYGEYEQSVIEFNSYLLHHKSDSDAIFNRGLAKILKGDKRSGCKDISLSIELKENMKRQEILSSFCPDEI